ncbi:MAG: hypothetical protein SV186_01355 [Candidatus Nanohaloarchaea archaeon]|nr:hypothetical protein [Candidatus Nanohaloarchaea archaeon]
MNNKLVLPAVLVLAVALAGCTQPQGSPIFNGPTTGDQGDNGGDTATKFTPQGGLTIDFSAGVDTYFNGETATFVANLKNTGQFEAENIQLRLYGASWAAGGDWKHVDSLAAFDKSNNFIQGKQSVTFSRTVDTALGAGQQDTYTIGLQTFYEYNATTRAKFTVMDQQTFEEEGRTRSQMSNTQYGAPVHITFLGETPYPYNGGSEIIIPVKIENVGQGSINSSEVTLNVRVENGPKLEDCSGLVDLSSGNRVRCTLASDEVGLGSAPLKTYTFIAEANYTYAQDNSVTVTVKGQ